MGPGVEEVEHKSIMYIMETKIPRKLDFAMRMGPWPALIQSAAKLALSPKQQILSPICLDLNFSSFMAQS